MHTPESREKVGTIAAEHPVTLAVFDRFGIDYALHGELSLYDACADAGADIIEVQAALDQTAEPSGEVIWNRQPLRTLTQHLESHHHKFTRHALRDLGEALTTALQLGELDCDTTFVHMRRIFFEFREELLEHMAAEEQTLFPYVRLLESAVMDDRAVPTPYHGTVSSPAAHTLEDHERAARRIAALKRLMTEIPHPEQRPHVLEMERLLLKLEANMREHVHLENNILFPRAIDYERGGGQNVGLPCSFENQWYRSRREG